jgi:cob(I)alamin adenosyltransferase
MSEKGLIHIYTGEGKGKTTSALGLVIRAKSKGKSILFAQFFKEKAPQSELSLLEQIGIATLIFESIKSPFFHPSADKEYLRREAQKALQQLKDIFFRGTYDLIVLDEFICLVSEGIISEDEAVRLLKGKPEQLEIVLTGRGATENIMNLADYVTYMKNIKHPFDKGISAREGIEV